MCETWARKALFTVDFFFIRSQWRTQFLCQAINTLHFLSLRNQDIFSGFSTCWENSLQILQYTFNKDESTADLSLISLEMQFGIIIIVRQLLQ